MHNYPFQNNLASKKRLGCPLDTNLHIALCTFTPRTSTKLFISSITQISTYACTVFICNKKLKLFRRSWPIYCKNLHSANTLLPFATLRSYKSSMATGPFQCMIKLHEEFLKLLLYEHFEHFQYEIKSKIAWELFQAKHKEQTWMLSVW